MYLEDPALKPALEAAKSGEFAAAASLGRRYMWEELNSCFDADMLKLMADWHITGRDLEHLGKEVFSLYRMKTALTQEKDLRRFLIARAYDLGQDTLDRGGLDEARRFFRLAARLSADPVFSHAARMFEAVRRLIDEVRREGARIDPAPGACTVASVVWGNVYIDNYLDYMVRSLLAPGNLPGLEGRDLHFSILTTPAGRARIEAHPAYVSMRHYARVHIFMFPEDLTAISDPTNPSYAYYQLYGAMDHMNIAFCREFGSHAFFLPVDCIVARNTLTNLLHYVENGYDAVGMTNMVAKREHFLPRLDAMFGAAPTLDVSGRQLADLALLSLHQETYGNMVIPENENWSRWARDMFWPVHGGVHARCVYVHPLCVSGQALRRDFDMMYKWVDLTLAACLFTTPADYPRFKLVSNTEEAYITNFATEQRKFESTNRPFEPLLFAEGAKPTRGVHRWFLTQPQFIPCSPAMRTHRDPDTDVAEVLDHLQLISPL